MQRLRIRAAIQRTPSAHRSQHLARASVLKSTERHRPCPSRIQHLAPRRRRTRLSHALPTPLRLRSRRIHLSLSPRLSAKRRRSSCRQIKLIRPPRPVQPRGRIRDRRAELIARLQVRAPCHIPRRRRDHLRQRRPFEAHPLPRPPRVRTRHLARIPRVPLTELRLLIAHTHLRRCCCRAHTTRSPPYPPGIEATPPRQKTPVPGL